MGDAVYNRGLNGPTRSSSGSRLVGLGGVPGSCGLLGCPGYNIKIHILILFIYTQEGIWYKLMHIPRRGGGLVNTA